MFLTVLFSSSVCALSISLSQPESANVNESFDVSISADTSDSYDVKIFVQNSLNKTISDTLNGETWKSSIYYIKSSWPSLSKYSLRAKEESPDSDLCVRMRQSGKSSFTEKCSPISILLKESIPDYVPSDISPSSSDGLKPSDTESENYSYANLMPDVPKEDKIYLNSAEPEVRITNYAKTRLIIISAFSLVALLLVLFMAFGKI